MTLYLYRCRRCGDVEQRFPIGTAPDEVACPSCHEPIGRTITAPGLALGNAAARRLIDSTAATAETPRVVSAPPTGPQRTRQVTTNPLHSRLPRP